MKIAMVLTPPSDTHMRWAAQVGVTDYVARYGEVDTPFKLRAQADRCAAFGLRLSVVEGYLPMRSVIHGLPERRADIAAIRALIGAMGLWGVDTLCYNFMPLDDWTRTSFHVTTRGGARTNEFDGAALKGEALDPTRRIGATSLRANLDYFLSQILPVAEDAGVRLAMHPDDPPVAQLLGVPQIMHLPEDFERLFANHPSPANGMCLCTGTFGALGEDVPALVGRFASRIRYVHFRNILGRVPHFIEPFHDDGDLPMFAIMQALRRIEFGGPIRPDHVPLMEGEEGLANGYSMLARLHACGYLRGLMHAAEAAG